MGPQNISPLKFWVKTDRMLTAIAEQLAKFGVITHFEYDSENVYEWFTSTPIGHKIELNVSRKHYDFEPPPDEPVVFLVIGDGDSCPDDTVVRELAAKVNLALQCPVYVGAVRHTRGDDFQYLEMDVIGG